MKAAASLILLASVASAAPTSAAPTKPHVVYFLVDDWGHANVGYHRQPGFNETVTPTIDDLVANGVQLESHYVHKYCSPTRSSLQSGRLPIHVNVLNADMSSWNPSDPVSGFAGVPRNMTGISAVMKKGGYATHMYGKWDAGMATPDHTPAGRGYDTSLIYFHHANDYWSSIDDSPCPTGGGRNTSVVDLWGQAAGAPEGPAFGLNNSWDCSQTNQPASCKYEDQLFGEQVLATIAAHDPATPFFLFWAPHIAHEPLEVPQEYVDKFAWIGQDSKPRQMYAAMVNYVDDLAGKVVAALKAKGMWDNLLWVSSADNGGPIYRSGAAGANNYPLRGGKMSNWQGGIRVNAYASGGLLPPAVRGTVNTGLVAGADWYTTFAGLAGVDATDHRAAAAGLPPVDGLDVWPLISGATATSPRQSVAVGSDGSEANLANGTRVQAIVRADGYKLMIGATGQNIWTGKYYPNASSSWNDVPYHCGVPANGSTPALGKGGCLFNLVADPTEHDELDVNTPENAKIVQELFAELNAADATTFTPDRGSVAPQACKAAIQTWKGFWGPFTN